MSHGCMKNISQLKWYDHLRMMGEEWKAKQVFVIRVEGMIRRGKPHIIWENRIDKLEQTIGRIMTEMKRITG